MESIARATAIGELAALRKDAQLLYAGDERLRHLEALMNKRAGELLSVRSRVKLES